jgi:hypothetical protein
MSELNLDSDIVGDALVAAAGALGLGAMALGGASKATLTRALDDADFENVSVEETDRGATSIDYTTGGFKRNRDLYPRRIRSRVAVSDAGPVVDYTHRFPSVDALDISNERLYDIVEGVVADVGIPKADVEVREYQRSEAGFPEVVAAPHLEGGYVTDIPAEQLIRMLGTATREYERQMEQEI